MGGVDLDSTHQHPVSITACALRLLGLTPVRVEIAAIGLKSPIECQVDWEVNKSGCTLLHSTPWWGIGLGKTFCRLHEGTQQHFSIAQFSIFSNSTIFNSGMTSMPFCAEKLLYLRRLARTMFLWKNYLHGNVSWLGNGKPKRATNAGMPWKIAAVWLNGRASPSQ